MNEKKRSLFGWLGILLFGQFVLAKFWHNHGTIHIPAENMFSWWVYFIATIGLSCAGLFAMWHIIKDSKSFVPQGIFWIMIMLEWGLSMIISLPESSKLASDADIIVGICGLFWFGGTLAIVIYDVTYLRKWSENSKNRKFTNLINKSG